MISAIVSVTKRRGRKVILRQYSLHKTFTACYQAMVRAVTHFTNQGFSAVVTVGNLNGLSQLKAAANKEGSEMCECGKPISEHADEFGRHEPCLEQIISTVALAESQWGGITMRALDGAGMRRADENACQKAVDQMKLRLGPPRQ